MPTNLRTLFEAYDTGIAECSHPWRLQADVANKTYFYSPVNGGFIKPDAGPVDWALPFDGELLDRAALILAWHEKYDVVLYAWSTITKQRVKIFFDSSVEYNGR